MENNNHSSEKQTKHRSDVEVHREGQDSPIGTFECDKTASLDTYSPALNDKELSDIYPCKDESSSLRDAGLKTLKDMKCMGETHGFRPRWINEDELKQEAIKWIKEIEKTIKEGHSVEMPQFVLRRFFNITEEDLENGKV